MKNILSVLKKDRSVLHKKIMDNISEYIYRDKRYNSNFAVIAICSKKDITINYHKFMDKLRLTDKFISLNENLWCVILDSQSNEAYIKVAENMNIVLRHLDYEENFYMSVVNSKNYNKEYFNMINRLFERLEYAIENNIIDTVIDQDYII